MKSLKIYLTIIVTGFAMVSCGEEFLTVAPKDLLTEASFFRTESDAQAALIGVYGVLQSDNGFANIRDAADIEWALTGDLYEMDGAAGRIELHSLSLPYTNGRITDIYAEAYQAIGRANVVIGRVAQMENLDENTKSLIIAQAKFLRGLFYYRLANYYGGVPLVLEELDALSDLEIPRSSVEEVWQQVEADLKDAAAVLPVVWTGSDIGRATKTAALGVLVRADLWQEEWEEAVTHSEEIIATGVHGLLPNFRDVFRETNENNREIVFSTQFRPSEEGEGNNLVRRTAPRGAPSEFVGRGAWSNFVPATQWVNAFTTDEDGKIIDERFWDVVIGPGQPHQDMPDYALPLDVPSGMSQSGYILTKYWEAPAIAAAGVNAPVLRYAEVLLNYAEALNEVGRSEEAMKQVNLIRARAELSPKPLALSKEEVLDAIFYERRIEFIWEPTGAFSDLNRRGRFISFIRENRPEFDVLNIENKPWLSATPILFPIPKEALDNNSALEQNPYYTF